MNVLIKKDERGAILMVVLWSVVVLSLMAWGLSRRSAMTVSLLETQEGKIRSYFAARGAVNYVLGLLSQDAQTRTEKNTFYQTAVNLNGKTPQEIFHVDYDKGVSADIFKTPLSEEIKKNYYGLSDERGKINLSALNISNWKNFGYLLDEAGVDASATDRISMAVVDFMDSDTDPGKDLESNATIGLEDQAGAPGENIKPKNKGLGHLEELLLVYGMTPDIFKKIKNDVTVNDDTNNGIIRINVNAASKAVLKATARFSDPSVTAAAVDTEISQAIESRNGPDGILFTKDDGTEAKVSGVASWGLEKGQNYSAMIIGSDKRTGQKTKLRVLFNQPAGEKAVAVVKEMVEL